MILEKSIKEGERMAKYTKARQEANARYDAKTYKKYTLYLRKEEDGDIIKSIEEAKDRGQTLREWLREKTEGNI